MRPLWRTVLGFLTAPLAPQFIIFTTSLEHHYFGQMHDIAFYTLLVCYSLTALCLLPVHLILRRRGRSGRRDYTWMSSAGGFLAGMLVVFALAIQEHLSHTESTASLGILFVMGLVGACLMVPISLLFWFIARPDLDRPMRSAVR